MNKITLAGCAFALLGVSLSADAATVIAVNGGSSASGGGLSLGYEYGADSYTSILAVQWTSSLSFADVTIAAQIASNNPVGATGHAFLTTQIGTGTTVANQVAASSFVFPAASGIGGVFPSPLSLFTGLTLSAGTSYFLTVASDSGTTAGWNYVTENQVVTSDDPGITTQPPGGYFFFVHDFHPGPGPAPYTPASAFSAPSNGYKTIFSVTGTIVPEPTSLAFLSFGLLLLSRRQRKTQKPFE